MDSKHSQSILGAASALIAYLLWGFFPIYWKWLSNVGADEILGHRVIWCFIFCLVILKLTRNLSQLYQFIKNRRQLTSLIASGMVIGLNWLIYIWAVNSNRIVECSLGYYINPLLSVLLGALLLKENLSLRQGIAVSLATLGVAVLTWHVGELPWVALFLALSFGTYSLIRKVAKISSMTGLTIETGVMLLPAIILVFYFEASDAGHFFPLNLTSILLIGAGPVTALPLLFFAAAANRLQLSTLGFFQYVAPSCQLALGILVYQEPFTKIHLITFGLIWIALILYSFDSVKNLKKSKTSS